MCCEKSGKAVAALLLANGADINAVNKRGNTPLQLAEASGQKKMMELLRRHGGSDEMSRAE
jgi:ankyrin repeat protein